MNTRKEYESATGTFMQPDPTNSLYPDLDDYRVMMKMKEIGFILGGMYGLFATFKQRADVGYELTYGGELTWHPVVNLDKDGTYQTPEGGALKPLALFKLETERAYVYEGDIVIVSDHEGKLICAVLDQTKKLLGSRVIKV